MTIIIAIVLTVLINAFNFFALKNLSAAIVLGSMYLAPVITNAILVHRQKNKDDGKKMSLILPVISTIGYGAYSYLATMTGAWREFALRHTVSGENFSMEIDPELFSSSDMIFIAIIFFALAGLNYIIYSISKKEVKQYA